MSSFARNMQRKRLRQGTFTTDDDGNVTKVEHEAKPQPTFTLPNGGYITVRYTRGYRVISGARLRAQAKLAEIQHPGAMREQSRLIARAMGGVHHTRRNDNAAYRGEGGMGPRRLAQLEAR